MLDNGLLKYYKNFADKSGRLEVKKVPGLTLDYLYGAKIRVFKKDDCDYFCKHISKSRMDAEILISQLYPRLGVPSAVYLPAIVKGEEVPTAVISDDAKKSGRVVSVSGEYQMALSNLAGGGTKYQEYLTNNCLKQIAVMQVLDTATRNIDRHSGNFFLKLNQDEKADGIVTIDHEISGMGCFGSKNDEYYVSFFSPYFKQFQKDIIRDLKTNPAVISNVTTQELAQTVGEGVDLMPEIAEDLKNATGYELGARYVSDMQRSFEQTAEDLAK